MSEIEAPRDDAGKFTPNTENLFGREYELVSNGFSVKKDAEPEDAAIDSIDPVRQAAADLAARRAAPENVSVVELKNMTDFEPKEARTVQQAGAEYAHSVENVSRYAEGLDLSLLGEEVDKKRAEAVEGDKAKAKHFGFELEGKPEEKLPPIDPPRSWTQAEKDRFQSLPRETQEYLHTREHQTEAATAAAVDAVDGLDEPTRQALKLPAVRAAIEQQLGEVDTARQQLATERVLARQFAQANLDAELAGIPSTQQEAWLQQVAQQDPPRFQRIMGTLDRVQQIQAAEQQAQFAQAQEQHQQFQSLRRQYSRASDAALGPMTVAEKTELVEDLVNYVGEFGLSREQFAREAETNLALHHPAFQRMAADAVKYRRITSAPKAVPQGLPPVQRPGVAQNIPRSGDNGSKIQSLQRQLATANGEKAARIAGQIRTLKRAQ